VVPPNLIYLVQKVFLPLGLNGVFHLFIAFNATLLAANAIAWLTGKKVVVNLIKGAVPAGIQVMARLATGLKTIATTVSWHLSNATDATLLRWLSLGELLQI